MAVSMDWHLLPVILPFARVCEEEFVRGVSVFDVNRDGLNELVVARTGFARAFRVVAEELEMIDRFNARKRRYGHH